mgnify:CR=1 FL=1
MLELQKPNYIFEVSWEVCNKVGGIHTVIYSKLGKLRSNFGENYILIGPDIVRKEEKFIEFEEDTSLFYLWRKKLASEDLRCRIGYWKHKDKPITILVDFTPFFQTKDKIFFEMWETFKVDSLYGHWDYIEPALFGYAAGKVIHSFYDFFCSYEDKIIAHFHEWLTGMGVLYLKKYVPQIATIFTTHATTIGRTIAGNNLPLYSKIKEYDPNTIAHNFNIASKYSLEKQTTINADIFTVVSPTINLECNHFLNRTADVITVNGFDLEQIPTNIEEIRKKSRRKLINISEALTNVKVDPEKSIFLVTSGRYEFHNKGFDILLDALALYNNSDSVSKKIYAFFLVPADHIGVNFNLLENIHNCDYNNPLEKNYLTHNLRYPEYDPILNRIKEKNLNNSQNDKVIIVFCPCYLNGYDGIFNMHYYDLLTGFDISVFPSYYEPWGYTPLESILFNVPTITTNISGFGNWLLSNNIDIKDIVYVFERSENDSESLKLLYQTLLYFVNTFNREIFLNKISDFKKQFSWDKLIDNYYIAYDKAIKKSLERYDLFKSKQITIFKVKEEELPPKWRKIFIQSDIPEKIKGIKEIAYNYWWSWNYEALELFNSLEPELFKKLNYNPIALLESMTLEHYKKALNDKEFIEKYEEIYKKFKDYISEKIEERPLIAYFCMEFGLHETLKNYAGGLGILAGDYLKQASDSKKNIIGIGLLFRYGYFTQAISTNSEQIELKIPQKFTHLPLLPVRNERDEWVTISIPLPGRYLYAKAWQLKVGRTTLYLLDADIEENSQEDRVITYYLYTANQELRLLQEILLGIGGFYLLEALNINPDIYHLNEGHSSFVSLARIKKLIETKRLNFSEALEVVKSSTIFTTHTPVPAGHDTFPEELIRTYLSYFQEIFNISWQEYISLGKIDPTDVKEKFSMSILATKTSQYINAVSKIHENVTKNMFQPLWKDYFPKELPISYVTNGVHFKTWVSKQFLDIYKKYISEDIENQQTDYKLWEKINDVPNKVIWDARISLKKELFSYIKNFLLEKHELKEESPKYIFRLLENLNENSLVIGFARRFATYKRAYLLFKNLDRLNKILNNKDYPVTIIIAGKAHPSDQAGKDLLKKIIEISKRPEFIGKILFIPNYEIDLARRLVQGCDVWLNTPQRPLEASGTSGQKAVLNGVLHFSVLDGWWAEGFIEGAGWALSQENTYSNNEYQDELDAELIYHTIENDIIPTFFQYDKEGLPNKWISYIKKSIAYIAPKFTTKRMLDEYYQKFYYSLFNRYNQFIKNNFELARSLATWKMKVLLSWPTIQVVDMSLPDPKSQAIKLGEPFNISITIKFSNLSPNDIGAEVLFGKKHLDVVSELLFKEELEPIKITHNCITFSKKITIKTPGVLDFSFRIYPKNPALLHRIDFPIVKWV